MPNIKKIEYKQTRRLARITEIGQGNPVLMYSRQFQNIFSPGFIAVPKKTDIDDWTQNRTIHWQLEYDDAHLVTDINKDIKDLLDKEKNKLAQKISDLDKEIQKGDPGLSQKKQDLFIYKHFSFNWVNPKSDVYKSKDGISIIGWGLCNDLGEIYEAPHLQVPETQPESKPQTNGGSVSNQGPVNSWWNNKLMWLLVPLLLLMIFLLKNCSPYAEIRQDYSNQFDINGKALFSSENSHDSTSIFSKGIFSETPKIELKAKWSYFKWSAVDSAFISINEINNRWAGAYLVLLHILDEGNRLKFWKKEDSDSYSFTIFQDTVRVNNLPKIEFKDEKPDTLIPPKVVIEYLKKDTDGDGTPDVKDRFPKDPEETMDSDGDGTGDNRDKFPNDPYEQDDNDGDGVGANADPDDNNPNIPFSKPVPQAEDQEEGPVRETLAPLRTILREQIDKPLQDGWIRHTIMGRDKPGEDLRTIKVWYTDPNGEKHINHVIPKNSNQKST